LNWLYILSKERLFYSYVVFELFNSRDKTILKHLENAFFTLHSTVYAILTLYCLVKVKETGWTFSKVIEATKVSLHLSWKIHHALTEILKPFYHRSCESFSTQDMYFFLFSSKNHYCILIFRWYQWTPKWKETIVPIMSCLTSIIIPNVLYSWS
jgi:branched-subunit amino acid transport protein AzlD